MTRSMKKKYIYVLVGWLALSPLVAADSYTINFKDTDIHELIKFVADATKRTMIIDPRVKGRVKVISTTAVNEKQLYEMFLAILDVHGYAAARTGNVITVVPKQQARSLPVPVSPPNTSNFDPQRREIITSVIPLRSVPAAKLIPVIRPLVSQQGHMAAYPPSNAIIISEVEDNINRILKIIGQLDDTSSSSVEVIKLKYAVASEVKTILESMLKQTANDKGRPLNIVADKRTNSLLVSADEIERQSMREMVEYLDQTQSQVGDASVLYLKHATAEDIAPILAKVVNNLQRTNDKNSNQVKTSIEADKATNSLIITASPEIRKTLEAIISQLDIRREQVLVEAIIVEVNDEDLRRLGAEWLVAHQDTGALSSSHLSPVISGLSAGAQAAGSNSSLLTQAIAGALLNIDGQAALLGGIDSGGTRGFALILNALKRNMAFNILSTPNILTLDNTEATIVVGSNVPFRTGSFTNTGGNTGAVNPFQTISRQDVGITLTVKPHINEGDSVLLELKQEISSLAGNTSVSAVDLITNQRKIETTVLAKDREIIVLGGLIREDVTETTRRVPLLGRIPLLGKLFRSSSAEVKKNNLLIFIRPTIIKTPESIAEISKEKYKAIRSQQIEKQLRGISLMPADRLPVLPTWEEALKKNGAIQ